MQHCAAAVDGSLSSLSDLEVARRVLNTEIAGLQALSSSLDEAFSSATSLIHTMRGRGNGRLILAGIGKSGHVARKIAATLASTATPSYYIHPGEASHGDLGMITEADVILLLSNSGENAELSDMIAYAKRFSIPLIAMTAAPESTLARHADIVLSIPKMPEACPNGLAPTTSTTMMVALGDALAVALLERAGLTAEQFRVWHPGGKLGQRLKKVADLMIPKRDIPLVAPDTPMGDALILLTEKNLGSVVVVDGGGKLLGIVTDGDLKRHMGPDLFSKPARDVMSKAPRTVSPLALGAFAFALMVESSRSPVTSLVVVEEDGTVVGLIRVQELLRAGVS